MFFLKLLNIINRETPIINAITLTGFPGYKELMRLAGLPHTKSRIPGEKLNSKHKKIIIKAYNDIKKIRI